MRRNLTRPGPWTWWERKTRSGWPERVLFRERCRSQDARISVAREAEACNLSVCLSWPQNRRWEAGLIWGIGKVL